MEIISVRHGRFKRLCEPPELMLIPALLGVVFFILSVFAYPQNDVFAIVAAGSFGLFCILYSIDDRISNTWLEYTLDEKGKEILLYEGPYRENFSEEVKAKGEG